MRIRTEWRLFCARSVNIDRIAARLQVLSADQQRAGAVGILQDFGWDSGPGIHCAKRVSGIEMITEMEDFSEAFKGERAVVQRLRQDGIDHQPFSDKAYAEYIADKLSDINAGAAGIEAPASFYLDRAASQ